MAKHWLDEPDGANCYTKHDPPVRAEFMIDGHAWCARCVRQAKPLMLAIRKQSDTHQPIPENAAALPISIN